MQLNYLAFAIPLFLFFMLLEYLVARHKRKPYFNFTNSVANINVGIAERLLDIFTTGAFYFVYDYVYRHYAIFHFKPGIFHWLVLWLFTDFIWYWYHRLAHEVNMLWAVHVVHHQSDDFNYTVAARITVFQAIVRTGFWAVLPVFGFTAPMIVTMLLIHGLYPFFVHTQLIGKLGFLEYILVTPSHHRVHHASNEAYLDKNYGDVFIIWDKLFGTFCEEQEGEEIVYGLTEPLGSHSFLWQHFHFLLELLYTARQTKGLWNKLKVLFAKPETIAPDARSALEQKFGLRQNKGPAPEKLNRYVLWQVAGILMLLFLFILFESQFPLMVQVAAALLILVTLINCGAILEQRKWIFYLEFTRCLLLLLIVLIYLPTISSLLFIVLGSLLAVVYFKELQRYYLQWVYS
ncbi:sterol desaturase family protein [Sediminibacterium ginsengisoli]|uniref:Sterol desaturase/sphingolipid hydroxylase, fatty acid hydroxylase superfamily n=1 Tax=Sediminibacterium ginsengisoli TaxID=413434 RepID=A0A1T4RMG6_9BACT|nr:sterol desaturase family protein [Sediminibacterium ginsengisoli]SKA17184.1 Sterol desaturase/sphingolipid hydroxylase, fatty acid hydroxylase superfamily [Sediminibacterium ginsengisoli]